MDNKSTHQISYAIGYRKCKAECKENKLIDKACKWLDENFMNLIWGKTRSVYAGGNFATVDEMIANFRKAMEE